MTFTNPPPWSGPSSDPNDEQFGDIITPTTIEDVSDHDAVLIGEPYDGAVIGRPGAADGPTAIRSALAGVKTHHLDRGPVTGVGDIGDITIPDDDPDSVQASVADITAEVHEEPTLPVFIGGDNSLTYPNVAPLLASGSVAVLSFDAHLDCRSVTDQPTSGTPYRQLHDAGLDQLTVLGARHFETSTTYHTYLMRQDGRVITAPDLTQDPGTVVEATLDALDADTVYVSVDMDVLDATAAPGVSAPTPGGISSAALFEGIRVAASDDRLAGVEVVECAPPLEDGDRTTEAAARVVAHLLGGALT